MHYTREEKDGRIIYTAEEGYRLDFGGETYPKMRFCAKGIDTPPLRAITEEEYKQIIAAAESEECAYVFNE